MRILKFGGTSVKDSEAIRRVITILAKEAEPCLVVVSAMATVTNSLVEIIESDRKNKHDRIDELLTEIENIHKNLVDDFQLDSDVSLYIDQEVYDVRMTCLRSYKDRDVSPENSDIILSKGELLSSRMIYEIFKKSGFSIAYADPRDLLITDSNFGEANPDINRTKNEVGRQTRELFKNNMHIITGGFVGSDPENKTTTIGRGGSDYSAAIFAAALNARELQIWTDVDGMMTCDPRIIPNAKLIKEITYREAAELAFFGAKVLHPKTIYPAIEKNIPVYILNSFKPDLAGTLISGDVHGDAKVKSLAFRRGISAINIHSNRMLGAYGFLAKTFEIFKKHKTSVDIIATSEVNISLTLDNSQNLNFLNDDLREFAGVDVLNNMAIVTLVGEGIRDTAGISARFFGALKGIVIRMVSIGASEVNISIVINEENLQYALEALHSEFFE